jgi:hypothetical protein
MSEGVITVDNVSQEMIKGLFDAAYMEASIEADGDIKVREKCSCWITIDKERRKLILAAFFKFAPDAPDMTKLDAVNQINMGFNIVRATVSGDLLRFDYDLSLEGGISNRYLVMLVKRFCQIPHDALATYAQDIVL